MRIAILGATSQIAKDLILSFEKKSSHELILFSRQPEQVKQWLTTNLIATKHSSFEYQAFMLGDHFDAIINFVGSGNPAQTLAMGASILEITKQYDELALRYVSAHPACRYIFVSSGAVYGSTFEQPVDENTKASVAINNIQVQDFYAIAKQSAEFQHRALTQLPIVDIRVFNYFSSTQDITARFFMTDIVRAIKNNELLIASADNIVRDYISPDDFYQLILCILAANITNDVFDFYTREPISKLDLLSHMHINFNLQYEFKNSQVGVNATGLKINYYSNNRRAEKIGYQPTATSLSNVTKQAYLMLNC